MRIFWDARAIAPHMGGIGHATAGWLDEFIAASPNAWQLVVMFSSVNKPEDILHRVPGIKGRPEVLAVDAGLCVAPRNFFHK